MAMAHKPPPANYKRRFWVARHARERLRERLSSSGQGEHGNGTEHLDDQSLNNLIDSLVSTALEEGRFEDIIDEGVPAQLVDLRSDLPGGDLWALLKDNNNRRSRNSYSRAVVTLLFSWMVERSRRSGKWEYEKYDDGDVPIGGLTDTAKRALQEVTITPRKEEKSMPDTEPVYTLLITWKPAGGERRYEEWGSLKEAEDRLNSLRRDSRVSKDSIRVFREVAIEAKIIL